MEGSQKQMSLGSAALIAGFGYILMLGTPLAESLVVPKLFVWNDALVTLNNISANPGLLRSGIALYLVNFLGDIIAAWALYVLLKPVNPYLSLFTAWMRIVYTILGLVAVMNLITVLQYSNSPTYLGGLSRASLATQAMIAIHSFRDQWSFGFIFFGIYLLLLGYLVFISKYVPKIVGICLMIAGSGWLADSLQPYLYPQANVNVGMFAGVGELVFMLWLFIKGRKLKETT
jgi:Domain of unknown function (DUF4386)